MAKADTELLSIGRIERILAELSDAARVRVLRYIVDRHQTAAADAARVELADRRREAATVGA